MYPDKEFFDVDGFEDVGGDGLLDRFHDKRAVIKSRRVDNRDLGIDLTDRIDHGDTVHDRHRNVGDQQVDRLLLFPEETQSLFSVLCRQNPGDKWLEEATNASLEIGFIFDIKDRQCFDELGHSASRFLIQISRLYYKFY